MGNLARSFGGTALRKTIFEELTCSRRRRHQRALSRNTRMELWGACGLLQERGGRQTCGGKSCSGSWLGSFTARRLLSRHHRHRGDLCKQYWVSVVVMKTTRQGPQPFGSSKIHQLFNTPATSPSSEGCNSVSKLNPESVLSTRKTRQYQPPHKAIHAISLFLLSLCGCGGCGGQGAQWVWSKRGCR